MQTIKFNKWEISDVDYRDDIVAFKSIYKSMIVWYEVPKGRLTFIDETALDLYKDGTHRLYIIVTEDDEFEALDYSKRIVAKGKSIHKYEFQQYPPIDYINYFQYDAFVQLDGITTIVGMSGAGKTYSALSMLPIYSKYFDKIAYLNYELPDRDIIKRFDSMFESHRVKVEVKEKLYMKNGVMSSLDLEEILMDMEVVPDDKVVFVIDNVGSVMGQEDNVYLLQDRFLKQLDVLCKDRGYHALALTQTVKLNNSDDIFDENGEIKGSITMGMMAGSIMLGNFSRSVLFTGRNGKTEEFKTKVLKKGTGLYYSEGVDGSEDYTRR